MRIRISGTTKERRRINLLLFWIVGPWKSKAFDKTFPIPTGGFATAIGPISIGAETADGGIRVDLKLLGVTLWHKNLVIAGASLPFHTEPVKGVIATGTVEALA